MKKSLGWEAKLWRCGSGVGAPKYIGMGAIRLFWLFHIDGTSTETVHRIGRLKNRICACLLPFRAIIEAVAWGISSKTIKKLNAFKTVKLYMQRRAPRNLTLICSFQCSIRRVNNLVPT